MAYKDLKANIMPFFSYLFYMISFILTILSDKSSVKISDTYYSSLACNEDGFAYERVQQTSRQI